ncbi:GntR family transcriptional regulator [Brenneria izbisi]|uniref:GntR family transcriptional regulator n=1 Tax=Brenneria izbisi TaxID=2939450 RepID=A0AA42C2I0_9GAMM|nr:GntR family transcriptional regulator [Brenneria izbisi]MCV9877400.1 GntR family transcriptional regulator [Brenneria izbisi]MCV9881034.1 GntR family transcriptional regulator [Brenneria izbisi]
MIYKSIAEQIRSRINSNELRIGEALPSEKSLAAEFSVSRMTIRRAIEQLIKEGLLQRRHGSGTYILQKDVQHEGHALNSFAEHMRLIGRTTSNEVVEFRTMPAPPAIARQLRLRTDERIYFARRVRYVDGKACMLEDSYLPIALFPDLSIKHLQGSKFAYIEDEKHIEIAGCYEIFSPILADSVVAGLLKVNEGTPLLQMTSLTKTVGGECIDFSIMTNAHDYQVSFYMQRKKLTL